MSDDVTVRVNGQVVRVPRGTTVAAAIARGGCDRIRRSVRGEARGALCGMGICWECRATIDGRPHGRTCLVLCAEGMEVRTDE